MGLISALTFGFLLGIKHALDADHIVAVSTIVSRSRKLTESAYLGIFWGLGHTLTLLLVGLIVLSFRLTIPAKIALSLEFLVGVVLIILGFSVIRAPFLKKIHFHSHGHDNTKHFHFHFHEEETGTNESHKRDHEGHKHSHKSLMVGMVHGLAGSATLMLLVLATVDSVLVGLLYILLFGVGSILGMLVLSSLIGLPFILTRFSHANKALSFVAGIISIGLGLSIILEIGLGTGLFV